MSKKSQSLHSPLPNKPLRNHCSAQEDGVPAVIVNGKAALRDRAHARQPVRPAEALSIHRRHHRLARDHVEADARSIAFRLQVAQSPALTFPYCASVR